MNQKGEVVPEVGAIILQAAAGVVLEKDCFMDISLD